MPRSKVPEKLPVEEDLDSGKNLERTRAID